MLGGGWLVVYVTAPREEAEKLATTLVEEKHAACINIVGEVTSIYWWKGRVERDKEALLIIKTSIEKLEALVKRIREIHSYSVPEIIALPITAGNPDYLAWIRDSLRH